MAALHRAAFFICRGCQMMRQEDGYLYPVCKKVDRHLDTFRKARYSIYKLNTV